MVMPIHGEDRVAFYKRRWENGDYLFYGTGPESDVLGAVVLDDPSAQPTDSALHVQG
jgi:hypothetical protein